MQSIDLVLAVVGLIAAFGATTYVRSSRRRQRSRSSNPRLITRIGVALVLIALLVVLNFLSPHHLFF